MKTVLLIASFFCISFSIKDRGEAVYGLWQGAYSLDKNIENVWVVFGPSQTMEFYEKEMKTENKLTGTYSLLGDTAILIRYKKVNGKEQVKMIGNINRTMNFVNGSWESTNNHSGSFYLQKHR